MTPQELVDRINAQVSPPARYHHPSHFFNSMRKHYDPGWQWPHPDAPEGEWEEVYRRGLAHARAKEGGARVQVQE